MPAASRSPLQDNRIFVRAKIGNAWPFAMIADTGSSGLVITPKVARQIGLAGTPAGYMTGAGSGRVAATSVTVRKLSLGSMRFGTSQALVGDLSPNRKAIGFDRLDGVIGYDQCKHFRMLIDADRRRLTFSSAPLAVPATSFATPFTSTPAIARSSRSSSRLPKPTTSFTLRRCATR
jgi:aspartyl protease